MYWMLLPFRRYFDFEGGSRRMEYWMFALLNLIVSAVLAGPFVVSMLTMETAMGGSDEAVAEALMGGVGTLGTIGLGLYGIFALAIIIPSIAVTVRRFHDRDMSGWWYLGFIVASFIPLLGFVASIALIVIMFLPGTPGPNRFGPDPKDPSNAEVFA
ncbi:DUF805 domain-containing protein [Erythrobacter sp. MTPC3]|uniref:DUF805 domain-containing protein n=1 Tax=Erythrobacter sp. MTPC3 TaxID=3056564 RepID=UPI0036F3917E